MSKSNNQNSATAAHPLSSAATFAPYDCTRYLKDEVDIAAYIQAVTELGDLVLLEAAHSDVARARTQIAQTQREA